MTSNCMRCKCSSTTKLCSVCLRLFKYNLKLRLAAIAQNLPISNKVEKSVDVVPVKSEDTQLSSSVDSANDSPVHIPGICIDCGEPINPKRLKLIPSTKYCTQCQEAAGDVFVYRGVGTVAAGEHLGGVVESIAKDQDEWSKVKTRQFNGSVRDSSDIEDDTNL